MKYLPILLLLTLSCATPDDHFSTGNEGFFVYVSTGVLHACALDREGKAWCWGGGGNGQLGNGRLGHSNEAIPVSGDRRYQDICVNDVHSCAVDVSGAAWCWGENWEGELGNSSPDRRTFPTPVETTERFTRISCGHDHTCALGESGEVWCWGFAGLSPQGQVIRSRLPVRVDGVSSIAALAGAKYRFGVLTDQGVALEIPREGRCDDDNNIDNKSRQKSSPAFPWEDLILSQYCMGNSISCGLTREGKLYCLGGLMGFCENCSEIPRQITNDTYTDLDCGEDTVCVIDSSGAAKCFGNNNLENLAVGSDSMCLESPRAVFGFHRFIQISTSQEFHCGLKAEGSVWCWGNSVFDPEGNVSGVHNAVPTRVELE